MERKKFVIQKENIQEYVQKIALWIKRYVKESNTKGVVIGMSGGVDCSVVARLCQVAGVTIQLVLMPYGEDMQNSKSIVSAMELINKFELSYHIFNIKPGVDALTISTDWGVCKNANREFAKANIRPRVRMTYLYEYAQISNFLVIGTGNLSERTVGYFTKWGDGAADLNPIGMLTKREVYLLAEYLQIPDCIIRQKPSAGLWEGQTDENELGITYNQIDDFILEGTSGNEEIDSVIKRKCEMAQHKIKEMPIFEEF